jgi:hypothetical protein
LIDKALIIVIFFYAFGFISVGLEYSVAQIWHVELVSPLTGEPMNSAIVGYLQQDNINTRTENIVNANYTANSTFFDKIETFTTGAAYVAWELVALMTGTYVFRTMLLLGVPDWFVTSFIVLYVLLLARAIIGYVRGI